MLVKSSIFHLLVIVGLTALSINTYAEPATLKAFKAGSYQQLLTEHNQQPFMLVVWSITCSSCLKDMALLSSVNKNNPTLDIVMLSTDDSSSSEQIQKVLAKNDLAKLENWIYADENTQKLQYEIDSNWYGELPRTYFFDKSHQRQGVSGVLSKADYDARIAKISP